MNRAIEAFQTANLFELGFGIVVVARFRGGEAELGVFLVDVYCLGVKDAFYTRVGQAEYDGELLDRILPAENRKPLDPPAARKLVEGAAAYAQNLGFAPHPDYKKACRVLGGINASDSTINFTYGRNGKPFYVLGRYDSFERCFQILNQLRRRCGDDGFDFLVVANDDEAATLEYGVRWIQDQTESPSATGPNPMKHRPGQDSEWREAQWGCRLSDEALAMARELGFSPRDLVKNIPNKSEPWKAPVEDWVRNLYEKRRAQTPQPRAVRAPAAAANPTSPAPPKSTTATPPPAAITPNPTSAEWCLPEAETELEQAEAKLLARFHAGELDYEQYEFEMRTLYRHAPVTEAEVARENRLMLARQQNFRRAAEAVAQALGKHPAVQKVVLFGSVSLPLRKEVPRFPRLRRAGIAIGHECGDVDLAVWLGDLGYLGELRRLIARTVQALPVGFGGAVPHHAVHVHILEPDTNRYRGRLCIFAQCPKGKPECYVSGCGAAPFLQQFRDYEFDPLALAPDRAVTLFSCEATKRESGPPLEEIPF